MWFTFCSSSSRPFHCWRHLFYSSDDHRWIYGVDGIWLFGVLPWCIHYVTACRWGFGKAMLKFKNRYAYVSSKICLTFVSVGAWSVVLFLGRNVFPELLELRLHYLFSMLVFVLSAGLFAVPASKGFEYQYKGWLQSIQLLQLYLRQCLALLQIQAGRNSSWRKSLWTGNC